MLDKETDRNNANWRFEDENHVRSFSKNIGFNKIEFHYFNEVKDELVSPKKFNLKIQEIDKLMDGALVAVISID